MQGDADAPADLQAPFNDVRHITLNKSPFFYLDDNLIFTETEEGHIQHVRF